MTALLNVTVPAAGTYTGSSFQFRVPAPLNPVLGAQLTFTYGSGGTSINAYLQTSFDGGTNWCDVVSFAQLLLASQRTVVDVVQGAFAPAAATDGTLAAGTANAGLLGPWWRCKYVIAGAYSASTLRVDAFSNVGIVPAGVGAFN